MRNARTEIEQARRDLSRIAGRALTTEDAKAFLDSYGPSTGSAAPPAGTEAYEFVPDEHGGHLATPYGDKWYPESVLRRTVGAASAGALATVPAGTGDAQRAAQRQEMVSVIADGLRASKAMNLSKSEAAERAERIMASYDALATVSAGPTNAEWAAIDRAITFVAAVGSPEDATALRRLRAALAGAALPSREREAAHTLAMLALQSDRYRDDPDYREAVDNVLAYTMPKGDSHV